MHILKELGIPVWKVILGFSALSSVNLIGFLSEIPRALWLFIDGYAVAVYFFVFTLAVSASVFAAVILSAFLCGLASFWSMVKGTAPSPDDAQEATHPVSTRRLLDLVIFFVAFSIIFSGTSYLYYLTKHLVITSFFIFIAYFLTFFNLVTSDQYKIKDRTLRALVTEFLYDISLTSRPQLRNELIKFAPTAIILLSVFVFELGKARALEIKSNPVYWGEGTSGEHQAPLISTSNGTIFVLENSPGKKDNATQSFMFQTYSGHIFLFSEL